MKFDRSNKYDLCYYEQINSLRLESSLAVKSTIWHIWGGGGCTISFAGDGTSNVIIVKHNLKVVTHPPWFTVAKHFFPVNDFNFGIIGARKSYLLLTRHTSFILFYFSIAVTVSFWCLLLVCVGSVARKNTHTKRFWEEMGTWKAGEMWNGNAILCCQPSTAWSKLY